MMMILLQWDFLSWWVICYMNKKREKAEGRERYEFLVSTNTCFTVLSCYICTSSSSLHLHLSPLSPATLPPLVKNNLNKIGYGQTHYYSR